MRHEHSRFTITLSEIEQLILDTYDFGDYAEVRVTFDEIDIDEFITIEIDY